MAGPRAVPAVGERQLLEAFAADTWIRERCPQFLHDECALLWLEKRKPLQHVADKQKEYVLLLKRGVEIGLLLV